MSPSCLSRVWWSPVDDSIVIPCEAFAKRHFPCFIDFQGLCHDASEEEFYVHIRIFAVVVIQLEMFTFSKLTNNWSRKSGVEYLLCFNSTTDGYYWCTYM